MASESTIRHRKKIQVHDDVQKQTERSAVDSHVNENTNIRTKSELQGSFWLTRILILRFLAFVQFTAFLVALNQNRALLGKNGLLPADSYLKRVKEHSKATQTNHWYHAVTLLWFVEYENDIDYWLDLIAYAGLALTSFVFIIGGANIFIMLTIWVLYHSIVNIGQRWYSFGWESQLLETTFLATWLCPFLSLNPFPKKTPTSFIIILGFRWLIFRIMLGAGLIKIRGDQCWRDLTCMNYHYETQPVPNPMAFYMHQEPEIMHKSETMVNHVIELVVPFMLFLSRRFVIFGGFLQIFFQVLIIVSGNLSFLNWLTIIPSLACFDDNSISWMFTNTSKNKAKELEMDRKKVCKQQPWYKTPTTRTVWNLCIGGLIAYLSIPVVKNLLSSRQAMNTSFDSLRLVNTYGAFGSVTKDRTEVIFQGTYDDPNSPQAKWLEYEFNCKPGDVKRRPCLISPYHYRLDWLMWFAAFQNYQYNNWLVHLAAKFLVNDELTMSLIAHNPFKNKPPPKFVRALHYQYTFTKIGSKDYKSGKWWKRERISEYLPIVNLDSLRPYLKNQGWHIGGK